MTARTGHACRTEIEAAVCAEMKRQGLTHEHRSLRFRARAAQDDSATFAPAIVARRGPILFLVEPVPAARGETIARLSEFLESHSPEIVFIVVAPDSAMQKIPPEAYDEIYAASDIARLTRRIREQDPNRIVRPFEKSRLRDTTK